jgi:hypothetical protein
MPDGPRYLRLLARVRADNTVLRVRTQVTEHANPALARAVPVAWAELLADDGRQLLRWPVAGGHQCVSTPARPGMPDLLLRAHIPLPPDARTLRLVRDTVRLTELELTAELPEIELQWPPERLDVATGRHTIRWRAGVAAGEALLRYSCDDGRTWLRIGGRSSGPPFQVDFDELPGGSVCRVALVYTAGAGSSTVISRPFRVSERAAEVAIASPEDGVVLGRDIPVLLQATVSRQLGAPPADVQIVWRSDRDGELGRGLTLWTTLSVGAHRVSAALLSEPPSSADIRVEVAR